MDVQRVTQVKTTTSYSGSQPVNYEVYSKIGTKTTVKVGDGVLTPSANPGEFTATIDSTISTLGTDGTVGTYYAMASTTRTKVETTETIGHT